MHNVAEDIVHRIEDISPASEIIVQAYKHIISLRIVLLIGLVFFQKNPRIRLPEAIYALLDITHHENIISARYRREYKLLNHIAVLILINIYFLI